MAKPGQKPAEPKPAGQKAPPAAPITRGHGLEVIFASVFGAFLGLSLLKFGNPPIMEKWVDTPSNFWEFVFGHPWPIRWAYGLLALIVILGILRGRWKLQVPFGFALLPAGWFFWQLLAAARTVDTPLTAATVPHLFACVVCFYLGLFVLSRVDRLQGFWCGLVAALFLVISSGWLQHFGGLTETRAYFWTYIYPTLQSIPVDYMKKISSDRIFATLFYPNSLAAALILLLPATGALVYRWTGGGRFTKPARWFLTLGVCAVGMACLIWSGSKAGWLVMLGLLALAFLHWHRISARIRIVTVSLLLVAGLGGFFWTYAAFFKRGAPSVGARFDYWRAAIQSTANRPIYGTGPGTFAVPYAKLKDPDSEMARLAHNDYLQQASDSGVPGFLLYTSFIVMALWLGYRNIRATSLSQPGLLSEETVVRFAIWLGLLGWAVHSLMDFNLYIPAVSWPAFALLGWLAANRAADSRIDNVPVPN